MKQVALMVLIVSVAGCSRPNVRPKEAQTVAPVAVHVTPIARADWPAMYERTGTVQARTSTVIASRVMGYIRELPFSVGDHVQAAQVLAVLDSRDLDAQKRAAVAAREEARSAMAEANSAILSARANLELAQATHGRMRDLFVKTSISNQEMDEANAKLAVAHTAYESALSRRTQLESKIVQAEEGVRGAEVMAGYTRITAPFAGVIVDKPAQPGTLAAPGAPLLTIEREGAYRVEVPIEQSRLSTTRVGQRVTVELDGAGAPFSSTVVEIVPAVDASSRTFTAKVEVAPGRTVRSGMFARVLFPVGSERIVAVPQEAITGRGDLPGAFVVENGTARLRLITVGREQGSSREVLSGLNEGDMLIVRVPPGLRDGVPVETRQ